MAEMIVETQNLASSPNNKQALVIGGGIAGLTAAWELAQFGVNVLLVEKGPFIGGNAANLACKATDKCLKCNDCLVEDRLREVSEEALFDILLETEVKDVEKDKNKFRVTLRSKPQLIDPEKCTDCGLCLEKCPEAARDAIILSLSHHSHPRYAINPITCTYFQGEKERICQSICPEGAINLDEKKVSSDLKVDGILLATGYRPFDPKELKRFNFTCFENMVTGMDLEKMLRREGSILRPSDGSFPNSMAFIQCVGSRNAHINRDYCSRVCCGYALRMALRIIHEHPEVQVTLFYMDIQNFGKDFDRFYEKAMNSIRLIRGLPGDFYASDNDRIIVSYYDEESQKTISETFDMVALSVGMMPASSNTFFKDKLGIDLDEDGFLYLPEKLKNKGIVIAGSAEGPMDVSESICHAKRAALEMAQYLMVVRK